jgi:four helix bundle protein
MFLNLNHKKLEIYQAVRELTKIVYLHSNALPPEEKFNMVQQVRRAVLSVKLNLAEGSSRKSEAERKRFYEIAQGSVVELDAAFETAVDLEYFEFADLKGLGEQLNKCFAMLAKMRA